MDDVHAGLLHRPRPLDVPALVEPGLELDQAHRLLRPLGRLDQRREERGVVGRAVDGRLDADDARVLRGRPHEGLDRRDERLVRQVHEQVVRPDPGEEVSRRLGIRQPRARVTGIHGSCFSSGRSRSAISREVGEVHQARRLVHLRVGHAQAAAEPLAHAGRHVVRHLEPHGIAEPPPAQLRLDGLEQVVGLVRELEVGVARDPEQALLDDLDPREEARREVRDHLLERHEAPSVPPRRPARTAPAPRAP